MTGHPQPAWLADLARTSLSVSGAEYISDAQLATTTFIGLGGDSLRALSIIGNAAKRGVRLRFADLLADVPLALVLDKALAGQPADGPRAAARPAEQPEGPVPADSASSMQEGLWLGNRILGDAPYRLVFACHLTGGLRPDLLERAIRQTARRHDGLRTVFPVPGGRITRKVTDVEPTLEHLPYGSVGALAEQMGGEPFDLARHPPIRFALASAGARRHVLVLAAHHILLDGWSVALVLREIFARYDALAAGEEYAPGPAVQADTHDTLLRRQRTEGVHAVQLDFWKRQLDGVPHSLELPSNKPRAPRRDTRGTRAPVDLCRELTGRVRSAAASAGITTTAFMLAALGLTAARHADVEQLVVGMPVAGRPPELAELVGLTVNLLPVRVDVPPDAVVADYLAAVHQSLVASLDNDAVPFADIVHSLGIVSSARQHPLVQIALGVHHDVVPAAIPSRFLDIAVEEGHGGGSQYDLELFLDRAEPTLAGHLEYATGVWDARDAAGFVAGWREALSALSDDPGARLGSIRCVDAAGRARLAALASGAADEADDGAGSLDDRFRAQVARTPDAPAVREGDVTLSYADLDRTVSTQADFLRQAGVHPGDRVLVACPPSVAEVVAVLGVVRSGAAYCGLDSQAPAARTERILKILRPRAVLGAGGESLAARAGGRAVPTWQPDWRTGPPADDVQPEPAGPAEQLAYVAFTSGSTGGPKGVCVPHRGVQRLVAGLSRYAAVGPGDRVLRMSPLSFDASTLEIWGALLTGATVEIGPDDLADPNDLGLFLSDRGVTVAWFTAGLFRLLVDFALDRLGGLRTLLTGGDVVSATHVRAVLDRHPGLAVVNGYGPTENTTFTTVHRMLRAADVADPVPIGRPVAGTGIHILDARHREVPPGAVGELYASGAGLAAGYLGDPERTAAAFGEFCPDLPYRLYRTGDLVRLDADGNVRFLGRRDHQVKVRGFRIEPDEVRSAVISASAGGVADCLVLAAGSDSADKQLVAAVVPAAGAAKPDLAALVEELGAVLPAYMVPRKWTVLSTLPVTPNGKIDREAIVRRAATPAGPGVQQS
ncbi:non-ribosomal peptide synthetase [Streptomyces sp. CMB-StM0423]|uniref:non-ribosomal peptide synthetase n=1 Tax=Streptomyces sp. CMB-StM0423 TaxID=2059884 RepID=UPI000C6FCF08|nr:amino acid adenylation domain-containing protein [Streptomyces sp. CMB-StM0423]AUH44427.1 non-ribosomal peptide synthetase [Streptomyces sp. CMB-StM0423]